MCIVATVCIVCADTHLNNISVTHISVRYIAARLVVSDKISFCICTEAISSHANYEFVFCVLLNSAWC